MTARGVVTGAAVADLLHLGAGSTRASVTVWSGSRDDPNAQARAARSRPLLLHSLTVFDEVIRAVLGAFGDRSGSGRRHRVVVAEVGVESGAASMMYLESGAGRVYCVEPAATEDLRDELAGREGLDLIEVPSPEALGRIPVADLYVLDGDHNHATVSDELAWITENAPDAVVLLHDVLWPCGRRDQYYLPTHVDPGRRHPAGTGGPSALHDGLGADGFVGAGAFVAAEHAGGERNGVLTAVEDRLAGTSERWEFVVVPAVFGLGVLVRAGAPVARDVLAAVAPWTGSRLLAELENNRIALYSRVLELQHVAARVGEEITVLRAERDALAAGRDTVAAARPVRDRLLRRIRSVGRRG